MNNIALPGTEKFLSVRKIPIHQEVLAVLHSWLKGLKVCSMPYFLPFSTVGKSQKQRNRSNYYLTFAKLTFTSATVDSSKIV